MLDIPLLLDFSMTAKCGHTSTRNPFRFPRGPFHRVAGAKERLEVRRRLEGVGPLLFLEPLAIWAAVLIGDVHALNDLDRQTGNGCIPWCRLTRA